MMGEYVTTDEASFLSFMSHAQLISHVRLFVSPGTVAHQIPLSMVFSRQEYWSGWPCPPPGDLPNPGIELESPALAGGFFTTEPPGKSHFYDTVDSIGFLRDFFYYPQFLLILWLQVITIS